MEPSVQLSTGHDDARGAWEMARGRSHPLLGGLAGEYCGYAEQRTTAAPNLEVPHPDLVLIVNLGAPIRVSAPGAPAASADHRSFLAGLHDAFVVVGATGPMRCVEARLSPAGARLLLGHPLGELGNQTVDLVDLLGRGADEVAERMDAAPGWEARFALLDDLLLRRLATAQPGPDGVLWAWRRLRSSGGRARVADLAAELGWSRQHLTTRFRAELGLPPKTVARVLRFDAAVRAVDGAERPTWAAVAHGCGYADQAHLNRDFRALAGITPGDFLRRRIPEGGVRG